MSKIIIIIYGLLISSFFLPFNPVFAQAESSAKDLGDAYLEKCAEAYRNDDLDSLIHYAHLARSQYLKIEDWENYMTCQNTLCTAYYLTGNYTLYQKQLIAAVEDAKKYLGEQSIGFSAALSNYSIFLRELGDHEEAIQNLNKVLSIEKALQDRKGEVITLGNLGTNYFRKGDFGEALKYYSKVVMMGVKHDSLLTKNQWTIAYNKLAKTYFEKSLPDSAIVYLNKSLQKNPGDKTKLGDVAKKNKIDTYLFLADAYLDKKQKKEVLHYVDQALDLSDGSHYLFRGNAYEILGKLYLSEKDYDQAISYFLKSKTIAKQKYDAYEKHYAIAEKDIRLADTYQEAGNYEKALVHYQLAIRMLSQNDPGDDFYLNPDLDNIYSHLNFLDALTGKANTFSKIYQQNTQRKALEAAYQNYELAVALIPEIRQDYQQEGSRLQLSTKVLPIYEGAIEVALALNELTDKEEYLHEAFTFCESNKAVLLLESINDNIAKGFAEIPEELLKKENDLRLEKAFYHRKLNEEKNKETQKNLEIITDYQDRLFDLDQAYQALIAQFEKEYPDYHQLKYDTRLASVKDIQQQLRGTQTNLIEYFFGEKQIYVFSITANNIEVIKVQKENELLNNIQEVRNFLNQVPLFKITESYEQYTTQAFDVYKKIVEPALQGKESNLVIITDDRLAYLPFEALLRNLPTQSTISYSLKNLSYLFEDYEISYSYSATLFLESFKTEQGRNQELFLGVAPSFQSPQMMAQRLCSDDNLYGLKCNGKEVRDIQALQGGEVLLEGQATKTQFAEVANQYQILHLATHACLDDKNPEFSKIYFKDDYITNNDLYNLHLNSDLAVLSACDTGSGRLVKGEGVMSLARGFIHAGCPSVVMSLWSVDDCATSDIMINFYQYLYQGQTKSQSLRQAKLDYITTAKKAQQHPYYWAAFVQIGNVEPLVINSSGDFSITWYWLLLPILFFAFLLFRKK